VGKSQKYGLGGKTFHRIKWLGPHTIREGNLGAENTSAKYSIYNSDIRLDQRHRSTLRRGGHGGTVQGFAGRSAFQERWFHWKKANGDDRPGGGGEKFGPTAHRRHRSAPVGEISRTGGPFQGDDLVEGEGVGRRGKASKKKKKKSGVRTCDSSKMKGTHVKKRIRAGKSTVSGPRHPPWPGLGGTSRETRGREFTERHQTRGRIRKGN